MAAAISKQLDVGAVVDDQKISRFVIQIVALSFMVTLSDGYNLQATAFSGTGIIQQWHLNRTELGPLFSGGLFGMLLGAPLLGYAGDLLGRRTAIITAMLIYSISTLVSAINGPFAMLMALRFIAGIGLGGLVPNIVALTAEFLPKRVRATLMIVVFMGITLGGAVPSLVLSTLVPSFGWKAFFVVGGSAGIVLAGIVYFFMPESIKFLVLHGARREDVARVARMMAPELPINADTEFLLPQGPRATKAPFKLLFAGGMKWITLLLWVVFFGDLMSNYFLSSWMPTLLHDFGLSVDRLAMATSMFYFGGIAGGLLAGVLLDRWGMGAIGLLFAIGCPAVAAIGMQGIPFIALMSAVFMSGFSVLGAQIGLNAVTGLIYPTAVRSNGNGWASAVGRVGGIVGPVLGSWLIAMNLPMQQLFMTPIVPLGIGAIASFILLRLCYLRFGSFRIDEAAAAQLGTPPCEPAHSPAA